MRRLSASVVLLSLAAATLSAAPAAETVDTKGTVLETINVADLTALMKAEGYVAETSASAKDVTWKLDGTSTRVFVAADGSNIQFYVGIKGKHVTLDTVNEFNRTQRYSRAYLDDVGDPCLELDLDLVGGITRERAADFLRTVRSSFDAWRASVLK